MQNWKAFITNMLIYWSVGFALILLYWIHFMAEMDPTWERKK